MDTAKAGRRGRPKGTGKDDSQVLAKVADILVKANETIRPTTAMKRAGITNQSDLRRLQVKWKAKGDTYLTAARERQEARQASSGGSYGGYGGYAGLDPLAAIQQHLATDPSIAAFERMQREINTLRPELEFQRQLDAAFGAKTAFDRAFEDHRRLQEALRPYDAVQQVLRQLRGF